MTKELRIAAIEEGTVIDHIPPGRGLKVSATVNLIRNHDVVQKNQVTAPKELEGLLRCFNPNCVTNHEKARTRFTMLQSSPLRVRCHYCERVMEEPDVLEHL